MRCYDEVECSDMTYDAWQRLLRDCAALWGLDWRTGLRYVGNFDGTYMTIYTRYANNLPNSHNIINSNIQTDRMDIIGDITEVGCIVTGVFGDCIGCNVA